MNSHTGLDYIIENREFTKKLASGESLAHLSLFGCIATHRQR